jgi:hypothetical protein
MPLTICTRCRSLILFGGVKRQGLWYCKDQCVHAGVNAETAKQIDPDLFRRRVEQLHRGPCPKCSGPGPVDFHPAYEFVSFVIVCRWRRLTVLSCQRCAKQRQIAAALKTFIFGWWSVAGFVFTLIDIARNIYCMLNPVDSKWASPELANLVRTQLVKEAKTNMAIPTKNPVDDDEELLLETLNSEEQQKTPKTDPEGDAMPWD